MKILFIALMALYQLTTLAEAAFLQNSYECYNGNQIAFNFGPYGNTDGYGQQTTIVDRTDFNMDFANDLNALGIFGPRYSGPLYEEYENNLYAKPFTTKREINWKFLSNLGIITIVLVIMVVILKPQSEPNQEVFHEKTQSGAIVTTTENNPTEQTVDQFQRGSINLQTVPTSLDHLYAPSGGGPYQKNPGGKERNATMILTRNENDAKNQLKIGPKILINYLQTIAPKGQVD